uniref:Protein kinase domain-containing protein n=1 Tax=Polytomella parva TaxID=51329 RepID=A0A7S0YR33_9CHLO|mmetsp:Transcript_5757/g.11005  ORF Transcript_5757/g.11005 Transcript_5757/m.11005 type:complete len:812 (+) Transcript_5757:278-2713(+)
MEFVSALKNVAQRTSDAIVKHLSDSTTPGPSFYSPQGVPQIASSKIGKSYGITSSQFCTCGPRDIWQVFPGAPYAHHTTSRHIGGSMDSLYSSCDSSQSVSIWILNKRSLLERCKNHNDGSFTGSSNPNPSKFLEVALDLQRRSIRALTRIKHPKILKVIETLEESSNLMIFVTEPIHGSLRGLLNRAHGVLRDPTVNDSNDSNDSSSSTTAYPSAISSDSPVPPPPTAAGVLGLYDTASSSLSYSSSSPFPPTCASDSHVSDSDHLTPVLSMLDVKLGVLDLMEAVEFLHDHVHVIHAGISPYDIVVSADRHWKLAGMQFTIACTPGASQVVGSSVVQGPPFPYRDPYPHLLDELSRPVLSYSAPEMVSDGAGASGTSGGGFSPAVDAFSTAAVAFEAQLASTVERLRLQSSGSRQPRPNPFSSVSLQLLPVQCDVSKYLRHVRALTSASSALVLSPGSVEFLRDPRLVSVAGEALTVLFPLLISELDQRMALAGLRRHSWLAADESLAALRFAGDMMSVDANKKIAFLNALEKGKIPEMDSATLRLRLLPPVLTELRNVRSPVSSSAFPVAVSILQRIGSESTRKTAAAATLQEAAMDAAAAAVSLSSTEAEAAAASEWLLNLVQRSNVLAPIFFLKSGLGAVGNGGNGGNMSGGGGGGGGVDQGCWILTHLFCLFTIEWVATKSITANIINCSLVAICIRSSISSSTIGISHVCVAVRTTRDHSRKKPLRYWAGSRTCLRGGKVFFHRTGSRFRFRIRIIDFRTRSSDAVTMIMSHDIVGIFFFPFPILIMILITISITIAVKIINIV